MRYNKYLAIIIVIVTMVLSVTSCAEKIESEMTNTSSQITETPDSQKTSILTNNGFIPNLNNIVMKDMIYFKYETCVHYANHVIQAKYEGVDYYKRYCEYKFLVEKQYKGHIQEEYIYVQNAYSITSVSAPSCSLRYATYETSFTQGKSYILILDSGDLDIYDPHRPYLLMREIIIPVDDISKSTMYGGQPLLKHSSMSEEVLSEYSLFIEYLNSRIKEYDASEPPVDRKFIVSEKTDDVVSGSDYIIKIKIVDADDYIFDERVERYQCEILTEYKGEIDLNKVEINFFPGTVEVGKEYIVAINSISPNIDDLFYLSSKNSVFSLENETEIVEMIENIVNS